MFLYSATINAYIENITDTSFRYIQSKPWWNEKISTISISKTAVPSNLRTQMISRRYSATKDFGIEAFDEACKGLSRIIDTGDPNDLDLFFEQLYESSTDAIGYGSQSDDRSIIFAISYVQNPRKERLKFSNQQMDSLRFFVRHLSLAGKRNLTFWLDQCLGIRDSSKQSWTHIGILPFAIWPVISLGVKQSARDDKSIETRKLFWPFIEEIAGLWGAGMYITRELRYANAALDDFIFYCSRNLRLELNPHETMEMILLNIFHGAADELSTGWSEDRDELYDMARRNILYGAKRIFVGPDWKDKLKVRKLNHGIIRKRLLLEDADREGKTGRYIDSSRKIIYESVPTIFEVILSGNKLEESDSHENSQNLFTVAESFRGILHNDQSLVLHRLSEDVFGLNSLWIAIVTKVDQNSFSHQKEIYSQIVSSKKSSLLKTAFNNGNYSLIEDIFGTNFQIQS